MGKVAATELPTPPGGALRPPPNAPTIATLVYTFQIEALYLLPIFNFP
jgi:hypothetical protein